MDRTERTQFAHRYGQDRLVCDCIGDGKTLQRVMRHVIIKCSALERLIHWVQQLSRFRSTLHDGLLADMLLPNLDTCRLCSYKFENGATVLLCPESPSK